RSLDPLIHVRVADVEAKVELEMSDFEEMHEPLSARQLIGCVFEKNLDATLVRKKVDLLQRAERRVEFALVVFFACHANVLDQIAERNSFCDFERALDLVDHLQPFGLRRLSDADH